MINQLTNISCAEVLERTSGKKLVILYPETSNRNVFISCLSQQHGANLRYYCIRPEQTTLSKWLAGLAEAENFRALAGALKGGKPSDWATALAADLAEAAGKTKKVALLLDEYDRALGQRDETRFWSALIPNLPSQVQVIINARQLGREPWQTWIDQGIAGVLGREWRVSSGMFAMDSYERPTLEIFSFGEGRVLVNGYEITQWDGVLPRNLFFYLIDRPLITRDEIFQTFWASLSIPEATNVFHVTKRKIADRLSRAPGVGNIELTQYRSGYYIPSERVTRCVDADEFREMIERAEASENPAEIKAYYLRALELYRGDFLESVEMEWAERRRDQYREMVTGALSILSQIAYKEDQRALARDYLLRALSHSPERDDLRRDLSAISA